MSDDKYRCQICGKEYKVKTWLIKHVLAKHPKPVKWGEAPEGSDVFKDIDIVLETMRKQGYFPEQPDIELSKQELEILHGGEIKYMRDLRGGMLRIGDIEIHNEIVEDGKPMILDVIEPQKKRSWKWWKKNDN